MARRKHPSSQLAKVARDPAGAALILAATPLIVAGAVALTMTLASGNSPLGKWLRSMFGPSRTRAMRERLARYVRGEQPFAALRAVIVGSAKGAIVTVFGPPRTAMLGRRANKLSIWRSDTWYYPLDRADRSALAIRFEGNVARDVERISVPTVSID
jgi:hypothetical protein